MEFSTVVNRLVAKGGIEKIGLTEKISVNVIIIAATNKNLANEVNNNRFREVEKIFRIKYFSM